MHQSVLATTPKPARIVSQNARVALDRCKNVLTAHCRQIAGADVIVDVAIFVVALGFGNVVVVVADRVAELTDVDQAHHSALAVALVVHGDVAPLPQN